MSISLCAVLLASATLGFAKGLPPNDQLSADDACSAAETCTLHALHRRSTSLGRLGPEGNAEAVSGVDASLDQHGYMSVVANHNNTEMTAFVRRVVKTIGGVITNEGKLQGFVPYYSGSVQTQSYHALLKELRRVAGSPDGWVRLAPPEAGMILWNMVRPDPWNCNLLPSTDPRLSTCGKTPNTTDLTPQLLSCALKGLCNVEHANAFRTIYPIGALPCCPTGEYCAAPSCRPHLNELHRTKFSTCTKFSSKENVQYMKRADIWPAYHGFGGSFELDTLKFIDLLSCRDNSTGECPPTSVDLVLDLGANTGYYTEKLTTRSFAKNYIMVEGNSYTALVIKERWWNQTWKSQWFQDQVPHRPELKTPNFEIISAALSDADRDGIDMCKTEPSFATASAGCIVNVSKIDTLVPGRLSPEFQQHFHEAQSLFIKIDVEGMDELVLRGMTDILTAVRGTYGNGAPRYLVNFLQFEFAPALIDIAKDREGKASYDIRTVTKFLEGMGFESFLIGPRYLPLSHGSWDDEFKSFTDDAENNAAVRTNYPSFDGRVCPWCAEQIRPTFTADVFVMRSSHPRATEIKLALGACKESHDFSLDDPQYVL